MPSETQHSTTSTTFEMLGFAMFSTRFEQRTSTSKRTSLLRKVKLKFRKESLKNEYRLSIFR